MPRPSIDLEPFKAEIIRQFQNDISCALIEEFLYTQYGIDVNQRTIYSRLRAWGISKRDRTAKSDRVLHARIKVLFFQVGLEEKDLLRVLRLEGFDIKPRTLKHVRHYLGLYRRTRNPLVLQQQVETIIEELEKQIKKGQIEGYGKEFLHRHIRNQGFIIAR
jgi:hypothetical protein